MINARNREGGPAFSPKEIPDKIAALINGDGQVINTNKIKLEKLKKTV
ncbi:hypothetical protein [Eubacterium limosum]|nr:hypothetical protein [Eubacterium limosum]